MHSRIYLIGFMGSGKTSNGRKIARMIGYDFIDMDEWIEQKEKLSVSEIFKQLGEEYFRRKETEAILDISDKENLVISTGGGVPCHGNNIELLNNSGLTIYLKLSPHTLLNRLKNSIVERPLLAGKNEEEMLLTIKSMLEEREPYYNQASMIIDGLERVNERVVNAIQRF